MLLPAVLIVAVIAVVGVLWFNRDPDRQPLDDPLVILSAADGIIMSVSEIDAPRFLEGRCWRIITFLSLWDVHVQRSPVAGEIMLSEMQIGGHRPALHPHADQNDGHWLGIRSRRGDVLVLRSAGILARRVLTSVKSGDNLIAGQRIGRILLGSRTDVFLPFNTLINVRTGQKVFAGKSVLARWPE